MLGSYLNILSLTSLQNNSDIRNIYQLGGRLQVMVIDDLLLYLVVFVGLVAVVLIAFAAFEYLGKRHEVEAEKAKERIRASEREIFSQRLRERADIVAAHVQNVIDYDFARDNTAGRETTEYKEADDSDQESGGGV